MSRHLKEQFNKPITVRLSPTTRAALDDFAANNGLPDTSTALRIVIEQALHGVDLGSYRAAEQNVKSAWYAKVNATWIAMMEKITEIGTEE